MYQDKTLVCRDCGVEFTFTAGEQEFYAERGFQNEPSRCRDCRQNRKANRPAAGGPRELPLDKRPQLGPAVGHVRDFIKIPTRWVAGRELWPWVFNVADMLLVGGVAILAIKLLRERKPEPRPESKSAGPVTSSEP